MEETDKYIKILAQ